MTNQELEKEARRLALEELNMHRAEVGLKPLRSISPLWWSIHGKEWIQIAREMAEFRAGKEKPMNH